MADIKVLIKLDENGSGRFDSFAVDKLVNNVSKPITEPTKDNNGVFGISLGKGYLDLSSGYLQGGGTHLQSEIHKYNGYMFGAVDEFKNYNLTITIEGENIEKITFIGDKSAQQFPIEAIVNGKIIYEDDPIWTIKFDEISNTHTIKFTKWNLPNYNACFTSIKIFADLELTKSWVDSIESLSQSSLDLNDIYYGVLPNTGNIDLRDLDGEFKDYIEDGIIDNSNLPIQIFVKDKQVQAHIINDSTYNEISTILSFQLGNKLNEWNDLIYKGRDLTDSMTAYSLLSEVLQTLNYSQNEIDNMLSNQIVYSVIGYKGTIKRYLELINIKYPYLESATYRQTIEKFCTLAQLQVYCNDNNEIKFISARPLAVVSERVNAIKIPNYYKLNNFGKSLIVKNKYDKVEIEENELIKSYGIISDIHTLYLYEWNNSSSSNINDYVIWIGNDTTKNNEDYQIIKGIAMGGYDTLSANIKFNKRKDIIVQQEIESKLITEIQTQGVSYEESKYIQTNSNSSKYSNDMLFNGNYLEYNVDKLIVASLSGIINYYFPNIKYSIESNYYEIEKVLQKLGNGNNTITIASNELIQKDTILTQGGQTISRNIAIHILEDYRNGLSSGTIDLFCGDLYNSSGVKMKDWYKGEIIEVNDIIYFEDDLKPNKTQRYWRVKGRKFKYSGSPTLSLELQEIQYFI